MANNELWIYHIHSIANQIWIFDIHNIKMTSKNQHENFFDVFVPYYHDVEENHFDSLTPLLWRTLKLQIK